MRRECAVKWYPDPVSDKPEEFERFEKLARAIVRVPKKEISSQSTRHNPARPKQERKRPKA